MDQWKSGDFGCVSESQGLEFTDRLDVIFASILESTMVADTTSRLVSIATFNMPVEAEIAKAAVEAEGIPCFLNNLTLAVVDWAMGAGIGYVQLEVPEEHALTARAIIEAALAKGKLKSKIDENTCLSCEQPMSPSATSCEHCGWSFHPESRDVADDAVADQPETLQAIRHWSLPSLAVYVLISVVGIVSTVVIALFTLAQQITQ